MADGMDTSGRFRKHSAFSPKMRMDEHGFDENGHSDVTTALSRGYYVRGWTPGPIGLQRATTTGRDPFVANRPARAYENQIPSPSSNLPAFSPAHHRLPRHGRPATCWGHVVAGAITLCPAAHRERRWHTPRTLCFAEHRERRSRALTARPAADRLFGGHQRWRLEDRSHHLRL